MEKTSVTQYEFLQAISEGFHTDVQTIRIFFFIIIGVFLLLAILGSLLHVQKSRKKKSSALDAFEKRVRKLNLTINEIDYLDRLSLMLKKPWKKYLLLSSRSVFTNSIALLQSRDPSALKLDLVRSISGKAGFEINELPQREKGTRRVYPGTLVKVVAEGGLIFTAEVLQSDDKGFEFSTKEALPEGTTMISVYLIDFAGISGFDTEISSHIDGNRYKALHSDTPRSAKWDNPETSSMDDRVYVLSQTGGDAVVHARLKSIRPGWIILEDTDTAFKKGEDLSIFLGRKTSGSFGVNGEVSKTSRSGRSIMVRLNHVKIQDLK